MGQYRLGSQLEGSTVAETEGDFLLLALLLAVLGGRDTSGLLRGVALPSTGAPAGSGEGARKGLAVGGSAGA